VIRADGVSKGYGDRLLFERMTFSIPPAAVVGSSAERGGQDCAVDACSSAMSGRMRNAHACQTVALAHVDQARSGLDPSKTAVGIDLGRQTR